jgi:hypothetical protein
MPHANHPYEPIASDQTIGLSSTACAADLEEPALYVLPHPLDHSRVVVTVGKIVVQRGEAVLLSGLLHIIQLMAVKCELIDVAPIKGSGVHGKAWCHGSVRSDDHVIVPGTAIPFAEAASKCRSAKSSPLVTILVRSSE